MTNNLFLGVHEDYAGRPISPTQAKQRYPELNAERVFTAGALSPQDLTAKWENYCREYWDAGTTPITSWKPVKADLTSGLWGNTTSSTGYLPKLGLKIKEVYETTGVKTGVISHHEPEDQLTGPDFVAINNVVRDILRKWAGDAVILGTAYNSNFWNILSSTGKPKVNSLGDSTLDPSRWWVADLDFYGIDIYSGNTYPQGTLPEHPSFNRWFEWVLSHAGAKWAVIERGFITGAKGTTPTTTLFNNRKSAIDREATWLVSEEAQLSRCWGYLGWSTPGAEDNKNIQLDYWSGDTVSLPAMKSLINKVSLWTPPTPDPGPDTTPYSQADLDAARAAGYAEGFTAGKAEGTTEGYASGFAAGRTEGFTAGLTEGVTTGKRGAYQDIANYTQNRLNNL